MVEPFLASICFPQTSQCGQTVILGHGLVVRNLIDRPATGAFKGFSHLKSTPLAAQWPIAALSPSNRINYFDCDGQTAKDRARKR